MIRHRLQNGVRYSLLSITSLFGGDQLDKNTPTEQKVDKPVLENETGWDRVKQIFQVEYA